MPLVQNIALSWDVIVKLWYYLREWRIFWSPFYRSWLAVQPASCTQVVVVTTRSAQTWGCGWRMLSQCWAQRSATSWGSFSPGLNSLYQQIERVLNKCLQISRDIQLISYVYLSVCLKRQCYHIDTYQTIGVEILLSTFFLSD